MSTFQAWPKIPRYNRQVTLTEKIDGTNAAIIIEEVPLGASLERHDPPFGLIDPNLLAIVPSIELNEAGLPGAESLIYAQSRTRLITPGKTTDNYGFAAWVQENAVGLAEFLGVGRHYGEWYGQGIQRNYGLDHKRFALFNTGRWEPLGDWDRLDEYPYAVHRDLPIDVVPVLASFYSPSGAWIEDNVNALRAFGSILVPGFDRPEGIVVYHHAGRHLYKILLEGDDLPKGVAA